MNPSKLGRQVILESDETGGYTVSCPSLLGCHSQGETLDEALANIKEAIELYLEVLVEDGLSIPEDSLALIQIPGLTIPPNRAAVYPTT